MQWVLQARCCAAFHKNYNLLVYGLAYLLDDRLSSQRGTMSPPPTQIGPYRIARRLGQGGMGAVYEAIQEPIERRVALKVLLPQHAESEDALNRFFNEARSVNRIEHPSIVQVSDYGRAPDGTAYLVMEYLRGESLAERIEQLNTAGRRLPWTDAAHIAAQIADALTAAHEKSIVHRDLKPGNVMLVRDPAVPGGERAKILDFGIAKLTQEQGKGTATNALMGTPQYMSPEQCRGAGGVDGKTDVYALGIMLYEMIAGRPPFLGDNAIEYIGQHVYKDPPSLYEFEPKAHPPLVTLIHRLLVKDKAVRPAMCEVGSELSRLVSSALGAKPLMTSLGAVDAERTRVSVWKGSSVSTLSGSLGQTLKHAPRRRLQIAGVVGLVVTGVLSVLYLWHPAAKRGAPTATAGHAVPASVLARPPVGVLQPGRLPEDANTATAGGPSVATVAMANQTTVPAVTPPVDSPHKINAVGPLFLTTKPDSSASNSSAPVRGPSRPNLQPLASEPEKVVKPVARGGRQVSETSLSPKPTMASRPSSQQPNPIIPPIKRPVRYED